MHTYPHQTKHWERGGAGAFCKGLMMNASETVPGKSGLNPFAAPRTSYDIPSKVFPSAYRML